MKLDDLTEPERKALYVMFHETNDYYAVKFCGCTMGRIGRRRREAMKKMGWSSVFEAVRALCAAGWNDEQEVESTNKGETHAIL